MTGWNPDGTPGMGFENVAEGMYVMEPPQFELEAKQRPEKGPMWIGRGKIIDCVDGDTNEVGNELGVFLYDPMYSITALGGLRATLARHGLTPEGLPLGDMVALVPQLNELLRYGRPCNVLVNEAGYVQDHVFKLDPSELALVVFEAFMYFDLGKWPEEGGRYCYELELSNRYFDKKGNPRKTYRTDALFRIVSDGLWQGHLARYSYLNYTLSAYKSDAGLPMVGPSGNQQNKQQETKFTKFLQAVGISDMVQQVFVPGGEALDARVVEAAEDTADPLHRPYILEWISAAAVAMKDQGHLMTCKFDPAKGFMLGNSLVPAGHVQVKQIGMPDQIPALLSLEAAKTSGMKQRLVAPPTVQTAGTPTTDARALMPMMDVAEMYNNWANQRFGVMVFRMDGGMWSPVDSYKKEDGETADPVKEVLIPYVLPIFAYGDGKLGLSRETPCRMTKPQFDTFAGILNDATYVDAVADGDQQRLKEVLASHIDITDAAQEILDQGF